MAISEDRFSLAQKSEREGWDRLWKDNLAKQMKAGLYWRHYITLFRKYADAKSDKKILDIGCGPVGMIAYLEDGDRYGLDPLLDYYTLCFDMPKEVKWVSGCGEAIPFGDNFFNVVITTNAIDHTQSPSHMLKEIYRVLGDHCLLFLTVNTYSWIATRAKLLAERMGTGDPCHPYTFSNREMRQYLHKSGFTVIEKLDGIGDLGSWISRNETAKVGKAWLGIRYYLKTGIDIMRTSGFKAFLKRTICFLLIIFSGAYKWPKDSVFIAIKESNIQRVG